jgi:CheY-like chemotaxis protein
MKVCRVLLVDDDEDLRMLFRLCLEANGTFAVACAASGEEAVALAAHQAPDIILLDLCMPGMDGAATLTRLRALPGTARVPAVLITAAGEAPIVEAQRWSGILHKPFDAKTLSSELLRILEQTSGGGAQG